MAESLVQQGVEVIDLDWSPPIGETSHLPSTQFRKYIDRANDEVVHRIISSQPTLVGMDIARKVVPGMHDRMILHSGPPVTWENMCGPTRGAIIGALIYEEIAQDTQTAELIAASGDIEFSPCHNHHTVGPMAGIVSPSMPVFIVKNKTHGNTAYCTQNEGLGKVLRYGAYGEEVNRRLKWMKSTLYPILDRAINILPDGINLNNLISQALHMGDECHNRNRAGTSLFLRAIMPALIKTNKDNSSLVEVVEFINSNDHFFLNLSMPAGKSALEASESIPGSTIVTVMARNGTEFGIRIGSMPTQWFTAPAGIVKGLYLPGFNEADANPDIGDSTITETAGYGAFAMAAAPAITKFVGGNPEMAENTTQEMYEITYSSHPSFTLPSLDFIGTPLGIDLRYINETGIVPLINTGIAHKQPGIGMVGAGILRAPVSCFEEAYNAFITSYIKKENEL